ncbi:sulfotransferase domain-containing protein, partial [Salinivibrio kushneri]
MENKKPNLFLVGAPKCGTTSMYKYLEQHKDIFFPKVKEPNFFSDNFSRMQRVSELSSYLALYESSEEKIQGDASVNYLCSRVAIKKIIDFNPESKFIVMLRNPCDMIYSLHSQLFFTGDENERDFEKAWDLIQERKRGNKIPAFCREPYYLQYDEMGKVGNQVHHLLSVIPRNRIHFVLQQDLKSDSLGVVNDTLSFLGLEALTSLDEKIHNKNEIPRLQFISILYHMRIPRILSDFFLILKRAFRIERLHLRKKLHQINRREKPRKDLSDEQRIKMLDECFE